MDKKPRFLIYDRKEVAVLVLLGVMVAVFAFTLGVHLGKRAGGRNSFQAASGGPKSLDSAQEAVPTDQEIEQRVKAKQPAASDLIGQATQDEVSKTGAHLDSPRQTVLPGTPEQAQSPALVAATGASSPKAQEKETESPKSKKDEAGGAAWNSPAAPPAAEGVRPQRPALAKVARTGYSLQIASYPSLLMAQSKTHELEALGFKPVIHKAEVHGIGTRFRVMIGEYRSLAEAEKAGENYRNGNKIDTFIVAKVPVEASEKISAKIPD